MEEIFDNFDTFPAEAASFRRPNPYFDISDWFGPAERPGFYAPIFDGYAGSGASQVNGNRYSGPLGGLDGYGAGFKGPVGGVFGTMVGWNDGRGQGGPMGGLYSTLKGTMGWGAGGFGGSSYFPGGSFKDYQYARVYTPIW